ncbi:hypothetical protein ACFYTQ_23370 [Nocardia sp. NPDC004068]|uniref:hypothetical protein n=1 Tax=Nocardia sp. NPDC004068 TaxID=3364303 RepID=UPI00369DBF5D
MWLAEVFRPTGHEAENVRGEGSISGSMRGAQRGDPIALGARVLTRVERQPPRQPEQLSGRGVQAASYAVVIAPVLQQVEYVPQMNTDHREQITAADLIVHPAQAGGHGVDFVNGPDLDARIHHAGDEPLMDRADHQGTRQSQEQPTPHRITIGDRLHDTQGSWPRTGDTRCRLSPRSPS